MTKVPIGTIYAERLAYPILGAVGVAAVPGSSFYHDPSLGRTKLRFCFCKKDETMLEADRRLAKLAHL